MCAKLSLFREWKMINACEQRIIDSFFAVVESPQINNAIDLVCEQFWCFYFATRREFAEVLTHHSLMRRTSRSRGDDWLTIDLHSDLHGACIQFYRIWAKGFVDIENPGEGIYVIAFRPNK